MTPCPTPFNLADYVLTAGRATPDKVALCLMRGSGSETWTFAGLERAVLGTATGLLNAGLQPGDRVLMRLGNGVSFPIAYLGAIAAGLVPIPTSVQLTAPEITRIADHLLPKLVLAGADVPLPAGYDAAPETSVASWADLAPATYDMGDPDRLAYIIMTSGTAGQVRAVAHAHRAIWARRMMWDGWYGLTSGDRMLHAGAFNWTYTLGTGLMDPWAVGATALIPAPGTPARDLPELMAQHGATIFAAAPGIYRQLLAGPPLPPLPRLRHGLSAGEKLPATTLAAWQDATGTQMHEAFGQSECSTFISGAPGNPAPPGTLGYPQPGRRIAVLNDSAAPLPADQPGQIAIDRNDPGLMLGYLDGATITLPTTKGWFLTGDTGQIDQTGAVTYLGRDDDMMNAGGFRVSPVEVEAALCEHPDIDDAAAVELRVKSDASVIAACYSSAQPIAEDALLAHCAARLARYKCPRLFFHASSLPRGANGKLLRRHLRQAYGGSHDQT